jgi:putative FmdB family regulatory protein
MPVYDYECAQHGAFEALRPMSESAAQQPCPRCGNSCARVMLSFARLGLLSTTERRARTRNEVSAHQPKTSAQLRHELGSGCCSGAERQAAASDAPVARKFSGRPWMINH